MKSEKKKTPICETDTGVKRDLLSNFTCQIHMENSNLKYATGLYKSQTIILHKHT